MLRNLFILFSLSLFVTACSGDMQQGSSSSKVRKLSKNAKVVYFATDSSELSRKTIRTLDRKVIPSLKEDLSSKIVVEGHCDQRGSRAYNKSLGYRRANAVKAYLKSEGIKSSRIKTLSYGESFPADPRNNAKAWSKNRRVITIIAK